jgi:hypothetical protein
VCLWCCWKDLDEQDLMEFIWQDLIFRMWEILILEWFLLLKIQINSKKPGFGRKNQFRKWSHLKAYHSIQAWFPFIFGCSENRYIHCKTMFTCWVSLFCNGFTLWPTPQATLLIKQKKKIPFEVTPGKDCRPQSMAVPRIWVPKLGSHLTHWALHSQRSPNVSPYTLLYN